MSENHDAALTYSSYLKVDELLKLQQPLSEGPEHDELLFIVIHQNHLTSLRVRGYCSHQCPSLFPPLIRFIPLISFFGRVGNYIF